MALSTDRFYRTPPSRKGIFKQDADAKYYPSSLKRSTGGRRVDDYTVPPPPLGPPPPRDRGYIPQRPPQKVVREVPVPDLRRENDAFLGGFRSGVDKIAADRKERERFELLRREGDRDRGGGGGGFVNGFKAGMDKISAENRDRDRERERMAFYRQLRPPQQPPPPPPPQPQPQPQPGREKDTFIDGFKSGLEKIADANREMERQALIRQDAGREHKSFMEGFKIGMDKLSDENKQLQTLALFRQGGNREENTFMEGFKTGFHQRSNDHHQGAMCCPQNNKDGDGAVNFIDGFKLGLNQNNQTNQEQNQFQYQIQYDNEPTSEVVEIIEEQPVEYAYDHHGHGGFRDGFHEGYDEGYHHGTYEDRALVTYRPVVDHEHVTCGDGFQEGYEEGMLNAAPYGYETGYYDGMVDASYEDQMADYGYWGDPYYPHDPFDAYGYDYGYDGYGPLDEWADPYLMDDFWHPPMAPMLPPPPIMDDYWNGPLVDDYWDRPGYGYPRRRHPLRRSTSCDDVHVVEPRRSKVAYEEVVEVAPRPIRHSHSLEAIDHHPAMKTAPVRRTVYVHHRNKSGKGPIDDVGTRYIPTNAEPINFKTLSIPRAGVKKSTRYVEPSGPSRVRKVVYK